MELPIIAEVLEASTEVPNLSCRIEFTHSQILELLSDDELKVNFKGKSKRGMNFVNSGASTGISVGLSSRRTSLTTAFYLGNLAERC
jgi:hypothetical protein